ncbi:MAG: nucleotidyltransferase domain-containing protein [Candidatus Kapabacteria bacterium]|nr:nucleotidyltransferase domain-containing protein [Candidatus Kapabacteria bacterium]
MVEVSVKIKDIIRKFVVEAQKDNITIDHAVLFGSYAKGTNHEYSDIDVAVISDDFEGTRLFDNIKLADATIRTSIDLETHPFRTEDFTEDNPFVKEILEYGIRIFPD